MHFEINYKRDSNSFFVKTAGRMSGKNFIKMAESILKTEGWKPNSDGVFDHQELDFSNVTLEDLTAIREFHKCHEMDIGNGKSAIVVGPDRTDAWNTLWSQGEKINSQNNVRIFENMPNAIEWIEEGL